MRQQFNKKLRHLHGKLQQLNERLELAQRRKQVRDRVDLEREWLADLVKLNALLDALHQVRQSLKNLPRRWRARLAAWRERSGAASTTLLTVSPQTLILRAVPLAAIIMLILAVYHRVPAHTTFESFDIFTTAPRQQVLVVHNSTDTFGELAYDNTVQALTYAHLEYDTFDLGAPAAWPDLSQYSALLFVTELLAEIDETQAEQITSYVHDGGGLAVVYRGWNPHLADLFGFAASEEVSRPPLLPDSEGGLLVEEDFFPGIDGLVLGPEEAGGHVPYETEVQPGVRVIATSAAGRPLLWQRRVEQGRVMYWNTAMLAGKSMRGLIVQSVAAVQPVSVLPMANVAVIQIDDFPASFSDGMLEPVASEYGLSTLDFYSQVWYPDMLKIARRYGLDYTFLIPFTYNAQAEPPFEFQEWAQATISLDGQEIPYGRYATQMATQRDEIGLHGYNHLPLTLPNWGSRENMVAALGATAQQWEREDLGDLPTTYVPPHNQYDEAGAQALTEAFPSLTVISGLYSSGLFEAGGNREFGPEPWNPALFAMPRATSGYNMDPSQRLAMLSQLGTMGVWTHFLHADDVFETPENYPEATDVRNPDGWFWRGDHTGQQNGFYYRFRRWLNFTREHYPWLRYVHTAEAHDILQRYLANQISVDLTPYDLSIQMTDPTFIQIRINDDRRLNINEIEGVQFVHLHHGDGYKIYTLRAVREMVELQLLIPKVEELR